MTSETRSSITLFLMIVFLSAWVYTEVTEYFERNEFVEEVVTDLDELRAFRDAGDRFTQDQGDEIISRIEQLEQAQSTDNL